VEEPGGTRKNQEDPGPTGKTQGDPGGPAVKKNKKNKWRHAKMSCTRSADLMEIPQRGVLDFLRPPSEVFSGLFKQLGALSFALRGVKDSKNKSNHSFGAPVLLEGALELNEVSVSRLNK
jgi:hypothetical protein